MCCKATAVHQLKGHIANSTANPSRYKGGQACRDVPVWLRIHSCAAAARAHSVTVMPRQGMQELMNVTQIPMPVLQ
jgi:hypothetical protein